MIKHIFYWQEVQTSGAQYQDSLGLGYIVKALFLFFLGDLNISSLSWASHGGRQNHPLEILIEFI